jgi:hypothetical protein
MAASPPSRMSIEDKIAASLSCVFPYKGMMPSSKVLRAEALFTRVRGIGILGRTPGKSQI